MLVILLHGLAGCVLASWLGLHAAVPLPWLAVTACAVAAGLAGFGGWLARGVLPVQPGHLRWTGAQWMLLWGGVEQPLQRTVVALDLGGWVLLRLQVQQGMRAQWRVADAHSAGRAWHGLRVALAAHAGAGADAPTGEVPR